ncbi:hypothetical protein ES703_111508 [subsurface metagenome]
MSELKKKDLIYIEINDQIDISTFCCESDELNKFFHEKSKKNNQYLLSKVYICLNFKKNEIAGFITLSNYLLRLADSKKYGIQKVPGILVGRLAVDNKYRGMSLGNDLLRFTFEICNKVKKYSGCRLLVVEIKKKDPILEYMKEFGFEDLHSSKIFHYLGIDLMDA